MSSAYFAPLVLEPIIITTPGKYRTRSGAVITVDSVSKGHDFECRGTYPNGIPEGWHRSGRLYAGVASANDVIELVTTP